MDKISSLKDRAEMLGKARDFFAKHQVLEVDTPALSATASIDAHIDLIPALCFGKEKRFLFSSPEYAMKKLLVLGIGDIYQLSHVFRDGELGKLHQPEFMMAEWYRVGKDFNFLIRETVEFILLFLGELPFEQLTYQECFLKFLGVDPLVVTCEELLYLMKKEKVAMHQETFKEDKDSLLNLLLGHVIEPRLGNGKLTVLTHYPSSQAALAKIVGPVAERFEVYFQGVELANGYHELGDAEEQRNRFHLANKKRVELGKEELPLDKAFIAALEKGLPDCCGVAVGFDRLMMLRQGKELIDEVISFSY